MSYYGRWKGDLLSLSRQYISLPVEKIIDTTQYRKRNESDQSEQSRNMIQSFPFNETTSSSGFVFDFGSLKTELSLIHSKPDTTDSLNEISGIEIEETEPLKYSYTIIPFPTSTVKIPALEYQKFQDVEEIKEKEYVIPSFGKNYADAIKFNRRVKYPYLYLIYNKDDLLEMMNRLINVPVSIDNVKKPTYFFRQTDKELKFNDRYYTIMSIEGDNSTLLADYFNDGETIKCLRDPRTEMMSRKTFFYINYPTIIKYFIENDLEVEPSTLRDYIDRFGPKKCHSFRPSAMKHLIEVFKAKKVLDVSAGWGDRLVGTIASNAESYHGFDPNSKLFEGYTNIIEFFGKDIDYNIESVPFETANVQRDFFDIAIVCPPSFDMEIYVPQRDEESKLQSIYDITERQWYDTKISVWISKCHDSLKDNGVLCVNITSYKGTSYVKWLLSDMSNDPKWKRLGTINYAKEKSYGKEALTEPIFIWKKIQMRHSKEKDTKANLTRVQSVSTSKQKIEDLKVSSKKALTKGLPRNIYDGKQALAYDNVLRTIAGLDIKAKAKYKATRETPTSRRILKRITPKVPAINKAQIDTVFSYLIFDKEETIDNVHRQIYRNFEGNVSLIVDKIKYPDGSSSIIHKNDKGDYDGDVNIYNDKGHLKSKTSYRDGVIDGWVEYYNLESPYEKILSQLYNDGDLIESHDYYPLKQDDVNYNGEGSIKTRTKYNEDMKKIETRFYDQERLIISVEFIDYYDKFYIVQLFKQAELVNEKIYDYDNKLIQEKNLDDFEQDDDLNDTEDMNVVKDDNEPQKMNEELKERKVRLNTDVEFRANIEFNRNRKIKLARNKE